MPLFRVVAGGSAEWHSCYETKHIQIMLIEGYKEYSNNQFVQKL